MKALTIWPEWAACIVAGLKPSELRTWYPRDAGTKRLTELVDLEKFYRGETDRDLQRALHISPGTLAALRKGTSPSGATWDKLAAYLRVTSESLKRHCVEHDLGEAHPEPLVDAVVSHG